MLRRSAFRLVAALGLAGLGLMAVSATATAASYPTISGSGSSWAADAIDTWTTYVQSHMGLTVNYTPDSSQAGRLAWIQNQYDFAGSDPPFQSQQGGDVLGGAPQEDVKYGYSYVPDTGGGTAFLYHIDVDGQEIRNLRLTPQIIFDIFTGQITNWDDSLITQAYGKQLPNLTIQPVIRSDLSGETYFLTQWFRTFDPSGWNAFCKKSFPSGVQWSGTCPNTEKYPDPAWLHGHAEDGSSADADFINSSYANGAIGYDEYAYALTANIPVAAVENPGGYFVLPTAANVAVALNDAQIDYKPGTNYLQQDLLPVYGYKDPRSYTLSEYSYLIVPRQNVPNNPPPPIFTGSAGKGKTLSAFINYYLCQGQSNLDNIGYSPLPEPLVQGGLAQVNQIPGGIGAISGSQANLNQCGNPTMRNGKNVLLNDAPQPQWCQKAGTPLSDIVTVPSDLPDGTWTCASKTAAGANSNTGKSTATTGPNPSRTTGAAGTTGAGGGGPGTTGGPVTPQVVNLASDSTGEATLGALTAVAIVGAAALPPAVAAALRRRRGSPRG